MIETILSIITFTLFVGTLTYILIEPGNNIKRSELFDSSITDNEEDTKVVMKRAMDENVINGKNFFKLTKIDKQPEIIICPACKNKIPHNNKNIPSGVFYEIVCPNCQCCIKLCKK